MLVQPNKAIVGSNAFAHESGIHQDGMLKERTTYEIMDARDGWAGAEPRLCWASTRAATPSRRACRSLATILGAEDLGRVFLRFKELADKKKEVSDLDLEALVADEVRTVAETFRLTTVQVIAGEPCIPTAAVRLLDGRGQPAHQAAAMGTGPVDAVFKAIDSIVAAGAASAASAGRVRRAGRHGGYRRHRRGPCAGRARGARLPGPLGHHRYPVVGQRTRLSRRAEQPHRGREPEPCWS